MVAKSYQNLQIIGEPFSSKGRLYVQVKTKNGVCKTVRWYSEKEYLKMYPNDTAQSKNKQLKTQKEILGFTNGYITIFKGNTYEDNEYFQMSKARYCKFWGWYFISTDELPEDLPEDVEPIRLSWDLVGQENNTLKPDDQVKAAVESLIYDKDISEFVGTIGERIELILTVEKAISLEGYYGQSILYTMRDNNQNIFIWITASKTIHLEENNVYHLRGTVKEHKKYKNQKQTILSRCALVK